MSNLATDIILDMKRILEQTSKALEDIEKEINQCSENINNFLNGTDVENGTNVD